MNRQELYAQAQQQMMDEGPIGEAWSYVSQLARDETASRAALRTRLLRAANDPHILSARRRVYREAADALDEVRHLFRMPVGLFPFQAVNGLTFQPVLSKRRVVFAAFKRISRKTFLFSSTYIKEVSMSLFSSPLLKLLADLTFLILSIRALWLLVAWGRMQVQIWRYRLSQAQIKARVLDPFFPVSRRKLLLTFVRERLDALPLIAPFLVCWRMVRTRLPYTRKERGLLMILRFLLAFVEMGLLFPTFFLGLPPLLYDYLVWLCWMPLWSRADAIERSCQPDMDDEWDERDEWEETSTSDNAVLIGEDDL